MSIPLVSVIMPFYNSEAFIKKSVLSILNQTYRNFELIIINDCSTDNSLQIVKSFRDPRIRVINNLKHIGVAATLNRGLHLAQSRLIARMDADDIALRNRFATQIEFLRKHPDVVLVGTWATLINEQGRKIKIKKLPENSQEIKSHILRYNPFIHSTIMLRKPVLKSTGAYDERYNGAEDYDLFLRIVGKYKTANIKQPLLLYRISRSSVTFRQLKKVELRSLLVRINALQNYGYSYKQIVYLIKPILAYFIPARLKQLVIYAAN